jgi:hypothetical protein
LPLTAKLLLLEHWASYGFEPERLQVVLREEHFPDPDPRETKKFTENPLFAVKFQKRL